MKIGIIISSYTGDTYKFAQKLYDKLSDAGKDVKLKDLELWGETENIKR
jgi:menaquinone-dependent protoporphyrinogen IX oxidase